MSTCFCLRALLFADRDPIELRLTGYRGINGKLGPHRPIHLRDLRDQVQRDPELDPGLGRLHEARPDCMDLGL
jgi:hypothetical protein